MTRQNPPPGISSSGPGATYTLMGHVHQALPIEPGLYVTATPIGNLADITIRALSVLAAADLIICEDSRISRRLLQRYNIKTPLRTYHDHNGDKVRPQIISKLANGAAIALISDAGTPLVSDPGFKLVREALNENIKVLTLPGPSAPIAALVKSGLPSERFVFAGFLPSKSAARRKVLQELSTVRATLVFFETGRRISSTLKDVHDILGERDIAVARELTKIHEELISGPVSRIAESIGSPKGEITLLVAPYAGDNVPDERKVDEALRDALEKLPTGKAASQVAGQFAISRRSVYERALKLKKPGGAK